MPYLSSSLNRALGSNVLSVAVVNKTHTETMNPISFVFETSYVSYYSFYFSFVDKFFHSTLKFIRSYSNEFDVPIINPLVLKENINKLFNLLSH